MPRWLERVCLRCLDPDPTRRYPSADELDQALAQGQTRSPRLGWAVLAAVVAVALLTLAFSLTPNSKPPVGGPASIRALIDAEDYDGARKRAAALLAADPDSVELTLLRGEAYFELRLDEESEKDLRRALELAPGHSRAEAFLGELLAYGDRLEEAEPLLRRALEHPPVRGETYAALARVTLLTSRYEEALALVEQALEAEPRSRAPALRTRGQAYAAQLRYSEALATFELALQDDPNNVGLHFERAASLRVLGRPQEAAAEYDVVMSLAPQLGAAREQRANCRAECGDLEGAIADAQVLTEQQPGSVAFARLHADYLQQATHFDEARAELERASQLDPDDLETWALMGVVHGKLGQFAAANRVLSRVLARDPNNPKALFSRASAWRELGDLASARSDLERLLQISPEDVSSLVALGAVLLAQNEHSQALEAFERASERAPGNPDVLVELGAALVDTRGPEAALKVYQRGLAVCPDHGGLLTGRSAALGRMRRYDEALVDSRRALQLDPNDPNALVTAGLALNGLERFAESEPMFRRGVELVPHKGSAWAGLGRALRSLDRPREALPALNRALEINPKSTFALAQRALTHRSLRDSESALADWDRIATVGSPSEPLLLERATTLLNLEHLERAANDLRRLLTHKPGSSKGQGLWIRLLVARGQQAEALASARRLLAERPEQREALQFGALAALQLDEFELARAWSARLSQQVPRAQPPRAIQATALIGASRLDEALVLLNDSLALAPESVNLIWLRGQVHARLGDLEAGLADCALAQTKAPQNAHPLLAEGEIRAAQGELSTARACLERARPLVRGHLQTQRFAALAAKLAQKEK